MELITFRLPKSMLGKTLTIAPIGDIQWAGKNGSTAKDHLRSHIEYCLEHDAYFVGLGDAIDMLSPSNRSRLNSAGLYDTAMQVLWEKSLELTQELYEEFFKETTGRWLGWVEGHHFYEHAGETSDEKFCELLKAPFLGTSGFIRIPVADLTLYVHHGIGGGVLPGSGLNRLYHTASGLQGADIYLLGHNTKLTTSRLSRPYPRWDTKPPRLEHRDIWLVNSGGFSKSNVIGHRVSGIKRGDYAEQGMMTPSPLTAPIITVDLSRKHDRIRVSI